MAGPQPGQPSPLRLCDDLWSLQKRMQRLAVGPPTPPPPSHTHTHTYTHTHTHSHTHSLLNLRGPAAEATHTAVIKSQIIMAIGRGLPLKVGSAHSDHSVAGVALAPLCFSSTSPNWSTPRSIVCHNLAHKRSTRYKKCSLPLRRAQDEDCEDVQTV